MQKRSTWNISLEDPRQKEGQAPGEAPGAPSLSPSDQLSGSGQAAGSDFERMEMFQVEQPKRCLDNLIVPESTRQQIDNLLAKVRYHHILYEEWDLNEIDPYGGRTAINLYGPPGTGKSFCAEAIAHTLKRGFIRVNYAEIESKYVGETPKNIKSAFARARIENAVLFFDEADSILGKRLTNVTQSADHGVNVSRSVMLMELDRFTGVTIFATNLASNYDSAFVRRILGHIELPLPDADCRAQLWRYHMPGKLPRKLSEEDMLALVRESDGLSGGDILNAVVSAATVAVQRPADQFIHLQDLLATVHLILKAKREIGISQEPCVEQQNVPVEHAPRDVQQRYYQQSQSTIE